MSNPMLKYDKQNKDFRAITEASRAFDILKPLMEKRDDNISQLADVWNAIIDLEICLINKVLDNNPQLEKDLDYVIMERKSKLK